MGSVFRRETVIFSSAHTASLVIWSLLALGLMFDLSTPADNVSVAFIYTVPIFLSLFEVRPRALIYATVTTAMTGIGIFIPPPPPDQITVVLANRSIAVLTQWLVAALVLVQNRRLSEARDQTASQRRFIDILSHEVGTALTAVKGHAYRLQKLSEQISPEDVLRRANQIRRAAERIETIVRRVQFASSLGDGTIPVAKDLVDVGLVLRELLDHTREEHKDAFIRLSLPEEPIRVQGDAMLLHHVFENVVGNSLKYSPPGSEVAIGASIIGRSVCITIADHGSGIRAEDLARIGAAYYRGRNSVGTSGAGLGLYVAQRLIDAHQGHLSITSEDGRGTQVKIELPQASSPTAV